MTDNDEIIQKLARRACEDVRSILNEEDGYWRRMAMVRRNQWDGRWYMASDLRQRDLLEVIDRGLKLMDAAEAYRGGVSCQA